MGDLADTAAIPGDRRLGADQGLADDLRNLAERVVRPDADDQIDRKPSGEKPVRTRALRDDVALLDRVRGLGLHRADAAVVLLQAGLRGFQRLALDVGNETPPWQVVGTGFRHDHGRGNDQDCRQWRDVLAQKTLPGMVDSAWPTTNPPRCRRSARRGSRLDRVPLPVKTVAGGTGHPTQSDTR